jgi:hypothetical protein
MSVVKCNLASYCKNKCYHSQPHKCTFNCLIACKQQHNKQCKPTNKRVVKYTLDDKGNFPTRAIRWHSIAE